MARREIIPDEIAKVLSTHGPVLISGGPPGREASARCLVAPFEDVLVLFVRKGSPLEQKLLGNCSATVHAKAEDGSYQIQLIGRAVPGLDARSHSRRMELLPWLPEGANPRRLIAVEFYCEEVDYLRVVGKREDRFRGKTPLGNEAPPMGKRWFRAAFDGIIWAPVIAGAAIWTYLAVMGTEFPLRWIALAISLTSAIAYQAGARLWFHGTAFLRWREGRAHADEAPQLTEGLLPPRAVRQLGAILTGAAVFLNLVLLMWQDYHIAHVTFGAGFAWGFWPVWTLHLAQSKAEIRD